MILEPTTQAGWIVSYLYYVCRKKGRALHTYAAGNGHNPSPDIVVQWGPHLAASTPQKRNASTANSKRVSSRVERIFHDFNGC